MTRRTLHPESDPCYHSDSTTVYLIHFDRKVSHAQHYIGSTTDLQRRLREHQRKWPCYCLTADNLEQLYLCSEIDKYAPMAALQDKVFRRKWTFLMAAAKCLGRKCKEDDQIILFSIARKHTANGLVMAANQRHIPWRLAMTWQANRDFEMFLKRGKHAQRLCPICCGEGDDALPDYIPF